MGRPFGRFAQFFKTIAKFLDGENQEKFLSAIKLTLILPYLHRVVTAPRGDTCAILFSMNRKRHESVLSAVMNDKVPSSGALNRDVHRVRAEGYILAIVVRIHPHNHRVIVLGVEGVFQAFPEDTRYTNSVYCSLLRNRYR